MASMWLEGKGGRKAGGGQNVLIMFLRSDRSPAAQRLLLAAARAPRAAAAAHLAPACVEQTSPAGTGSGNAMLVMCGLSTLTCTR